MTSGSDELRLTHRCARALTIAPVSPRVGALHAPPLRVARCASDIGIRPLLA
jgi:hypothetical protein